MAATSAPLQVSPPFQPLYLKALGNFFSYLFHPLFIPVYVSAYLIFIHPYSFAVYSEKQKLLRISSIFIQTVFFPALTVFLLWRLGFANSVFLRTKKERIIPYVASNTFFFWAFLVSKNLPGSPVIMTSFFLGIFLASAAALMANNYFKISMHALAVGGAAAYIILLGLIDAETGGLPLSITVIIAGIVCTSRLLVSDHNAYEVYWGLVLGAISQVVACYFII